MVVIMPMLVIAEFVEAFENFYDANQAFRTAMMNDINLPRYLPLYLGIVEKSGYAAIAAMTEIYKHTDTSLTAGLQCVSPETVEATVQLNAAKDRVKAAVQALKKQANPALRIKPLDRLVARLSHAADPENTVFERQIKRMALGSIDLVRLYAHVRILPIGTESIGWTWAKRHSTIVKLSRDEAVEQAKKLVNPDQQQLALRRLSYLKDTDSLAYKNPLPNQLRANLSINVEGERTRKAVTISGICLVQSKQLPKYAWRDDPATLGLDHGNLLNRLSRHDEIIEKEPYIQFLHLHRYAG